MGRESGGTSAIGLSEINITAAEQRLQPMRYFGLQRASGRHREEIRCYNFVSGFTDWHALFCKSTFWDALSLEYGARHRGKIGLWDMCCTLTTMWMQRLQTDALIATWWILVSEICPITDSMGVHVERIPLDGERSARRRRGCLRGSPLPLPSTPFLTLPSEKGKGEGALQKGRGREREGVRFSYNNIPKMPV